MKEYHGSSGGQPAGLLYTGSSMHVAKSSRYLPTSTQSIREIAASLLEKLLQLLGESKKALAKLNSIVLLVLCSFGSSLI